MPDDMNKPPPPRKHDRHPYGPRAIGALLPGVTRPAFRKRSPATATLLADWPTIVGPKLAAITEPRRLAAGTLTLGCAGPVALELQHLAAPLLERINAHLGGATVERLRLVQDGGPAPQPAPAPAPRLDPLPIPGLPPGELHDALATLGARLRADRA